MIGVRNPIEFTALRVDIDGYVAELTLTRPELLNRFDAALHREFLQALLHLREWTDLRAVVLASTGAVFSAGGDFDFMLDLHAELPRRLAALEEGGLLLEALMDLPIPIVAALHGDSVGLGTTIVLACDAVVAARQAALSDPHVTIGLVAGDGGCVLWPQCAGLLRARRYLLTGDRIRAEDALAMGLVTDLVDTPEEALPEARRLARRIASLPPIAVRGTKQALNAIARQRAGEVLQLSLACEAHSMASDDLVEAVEAFRSRRPATYQGR